MNTVLMLSNVRLAFSDSLIEAKTIQGGKPRFGCNLIVEDAPTRKQIQSAMEEIVKTEFGGRDLNEKDVAFRDGNKNISNKTNEVYTGFADNWYISANRAEKQGPPLIIDRRKNPVTDKRDAAFPEAGDYVNAKVSFYSVNGKNDPKTNAAYGKKICAQIEVVQMSRKGDPFGASKPTPEGFAELPEDEEADMMA